MNRRPEHLAYSTLVHAGDTWAEMRESLEQHAPAVKARVSPDAPYAVSLRISGASAAELAGDAVERARLRSWLEDRDMFVYTVNAFPHGPFKGRVVMEDVYEPDWSTQERLDYTCTVADILAEISPEGVAPSIQSSPLAFRAKVTSPEDLDRLTESVIRVVAHLVALEERTGRRVKLALEPEPACILETTEETIAWFREHAWSAHSRRLLAELTGLPDSEVIGLVRRHLGIVFDICHQSVQFEDIGQSLRHLRAAGVPVFKLQAAAALRVPQVTPEAVEKLEAFTDTIYLSQTTERRDGRLTRFLHLADAIAAWRADPSGADREWRTHFHVPVFIDDLDGLSTTRDGITAALRVHAEVPVSDHLEIETYTWDVLPGRFKDGDIDDYVSRELDWVTRELASLRVAG